MQIEETPSESISQMGWMNPQSFTIIERGVAGAVADVSQNPTAVIQPGQQATILLELEQDVSFGRDAQIKLTTANGAVFVGTVVAGQQSG